MFADFSSLLQAVRQGGAQRRVAVASAEDIPVLEAVAQAHRERIAESILIGDAGRIRSLLTQLGEEESQYEIVDCPHEQTGQKAVELVRNGTADILMKGMMQTKELLGPVVRRENGLRTGRVMSHFALNELPGYHKLIVNTDGGMLIAPTLEEKRSLIENAVVALHRMGCTCPKVAVLAGVETVNPKMPETLEAAELAAMNERGELGDCIVEGPVSYDVAMSREIAKHKGVNYRCCGDYDVLVPPDLAAGNILGKCWAVTAHAKMAGIILGAKAPVIITSRGSTAEEKLNSIALAALACGEDMR